MSSGPSAAASAGPAAPRPPAAGSMVLAGGAELDPDTPAGRVLAGGGTVAVVTLAAAFARPDALAARIADWAAAVGVTALPVTAVRRADALSPAVAAPVADADAVLVLDGSPAHLVSSLKATPLLDAVTAAADRGATVVWSGAGAAAACDPMVDERGGALTVGLGLCAGIVAAAAWERWPRPRQRRLRTMVPDDVLFVALSSGAAVQSTGDGGWAAVGGDMEVTRAGAPVEI